MTKSKGNEHSMQSIGDETGQRQLGFAAAVLRCLLLASGGLQVRINERDLIRSRWYKREARYP